MTTEAVIYGIFSWMLYYEDSDIEILVDDQNRLYQIDHDNSFADQSRFLNFKKLEDAEIDFRQIHKFLKNLEMLNDQELTAYIKGRILSYDVHNGVDIDRKLKLFIGRKNNVRQVLYNRYSASLNFNKQDFKGGKYFLCRLDTMRKLLREIITNMRNELSLKGKVMGNNRVSIITSGEALRYLRTSYDETLDNGADNFSWEEVFRYVNTAVYSLKSMRRNSADPREKIAITLYIVRLNDFIMNSGKKYGNFTDSELDRLLSPIVHRVESFINSRRFDQANALYGYRDNLKVRKSDRFIDGLLYLYLGERSRAYEAFLELKKKF